MYFTFASDNWQTNHTHTDTGYLALAQSLNGDNIIAGENVGCVLRHRPFGSFQSGSAVYNGLYNNTPIYTTNAHVFLGHLGSDGNLKTKMSVTFGEFGSFRITKVVRHSAYTEAESGNVSDIALFTTQGHPNISGKKHCFDKPTRKTEIINIGFPPSCAFYTQSIRFDQKKRAFISKIDEVNATYLSTDYGHTSYTQRTLLDYEGRMYSGLSGGMAVTQNAGEYFAITGVSEVVLAKPKNETPLWQKLRSRSRGWSYIFAELTGLKTPFFHKIDREFIQYYPFSLNQTWILNTIAKLANTIELELAIRTS